MIRNIFLICSCLFLFIRCTSAEIIENTEDPEIINENPPTFISYEMQVVEIVNTERVKQKLSPLSVDESLMKSCDVRAKELVKSFSHTRPDGSSCFTSIETSYNAAGENIAYGQNSAQAVMTGWMNSEGHRNNILSDSYTHIGVGCYENNNRLYWVQLFIRKK